LVVSGQVAQGHNMYFIVNHWPSRRGGPEESEPRRLQVASQVREVVNKLQAREEHAKIVLMGDFNDEGNNKSISQVLKAKQNWNQVQDNDLLNVMTQLSQPEDEGTLTYQGNWNLFDQFIISSDLASPGAEVGYVKNSAEIYNPTWLQVGFGRSKLAPRRAIFNDEFQPEGFSDHFPIAMNLGVR
jgi:predicted extracellular nuclease